MNRLASPGYIRIDVKIASGGAEGRTLKLKAGIATREDLDLR